MIVGEEREAKCLLVIIYTYTVHIKLLTVESRDTEILVFLILPHLAASQYLDGEGGRGGEGVDA